MILNKKAKFQRVCFIKASNRSEEGDLPDTLQHFPRGGRAKDSRIHHLTSRFWVTSIPSQIVSQNEVSNVKNFPNQLQSLIYETREERKEGRRFQSQNKYFTSSFVVRGRPGDSTLGRDLRRGAMLSKFVGECIRLAPLE